MDWSCALEAIPATWTLTPVKGKKPYRTNWSKENTVPRDTIIDEITTGRASGYGVRTGDVSGGLLAIDQDGLAAKAMLVHMSRGKIPPTVTATSGIPHHQQYFYKIPEDTDEPLWNKLVFFAENEKSEQLEFRYNRLQSCLPPSERSLDVRYTWRERHSPKDLSVACAPLWVIELLKKPALGGCGKQDAANLFVEAAWDGQMAEVEALLARGVDVNTKTNDGYFALLRTAWEGHDEIVVRLLERGAHPDEKDRFGNTPLSIAAEFGYASTIESLMRYGADIHTTNQEGRTPLHQAVWGGHGETVVFLLKHGAVASIVDINGETPGTIAERYGYADIASLLRSGS